MANFRTFLKAGHPPTLFASFLYFDFCFAIWVLNGAMAPFISEEFHLSPAQKGFMVSVPILAGALMRFPMGISGAGNSGTVLAMLFAPPLATIYGWQAVYGIGALFMLLPIIVMIIFA